MTRHRNRLFCAALGLALAACPSPAAGDDRRLASEPRPAPVVKVTDDGGFDLGSAGIGAAATFGVVLSVAGAGLVLRSRRPPAGPRNHTPTWKDGLS